MDEFLTIHLPASLVTMLTVVVCVVLHYEALFLLSNLLERLPRLRRVRMIFVILGSMCAHVCQIWIFAFGYMALSAFHLGAVLQGSQELGLLDTVYFSGITFTTIGYGDVVPLGPARFMAAMEALTGLVLIAWSASFAYVEMGKFWRVGRS